MRIFNRFAILALLLVLPLAAFAQSQSSSSQVTASSSATAERMSQLIGEMAVFPDGQQAGAVRDIVVGDKGDFSYLVIEFTPQVLNAAANAAQSGTNPATENKPGTATGTTQTPSGGTGTNTTQGGTTAQSQTPSGASSSANQSSTGSSTTVTSGAAASTNRYLVPVTDATFDVGLKTITLSFGEKDVLSLQTMQGDQIPATLGVGTAGSSMSSGTSSQSQPSAQSSTSSSNNTQTGTASSGTGNTTGTAQTPSGASSSGTQSSTTTQSSSTGSAMMSQNNVSSTQWLLGTQLKDYTIVDAQGKDLGKISDAMLDLANHTVAYFAFGVGGFLGIGEKTIPLPMTDITSWDMANHKIMVTLTSDQLKNAKGLNKSDWPVSASSVSSGQTQ